MVLCYTYGTFSLQEAQLQSITEDNEDMLHNVSCVVVTDSSTAADIHMIYINNHYFVSSYFTQIYHGCY
jgi:hypothetical protein